MDAYSTRGLVAATIFAECYDLQAFVRRATDAGAVLGEWDVLLTRDERSIHYRLPRGVNGPKAPTVAHVLGTLAVDFRRFAVKDAACAALAAGAPTLPAFLDTPAFRHADVLGASATEPADLPRLMAALEWCLGTTVYAEFVRDAGAVDAAGEVDGVEGTPALVTATPVGAATPGASGGPAPAVRSRRHSAAA